MGIGFIYAEKANFYLGFWFGQLEGWGAICKDWEHNDELDFGLSDYQASVRHQCGHSPHCGWLDR